MIYTRHFLVRLHPGQLTQKKQQANRHQNMFARSGDINPMRDRYLSRMEDRGGGRADRMDRDRNASLSRNPSSTNKYSRTDSKDATSSTEADSKSMGIADAKEMTFLELVRVLKPYFWPDAGSDGAFANRVRSTLTWFLVAASRITSVYSPFYISSAANNLVIVDWSAAAKDMVGYCLLLVASVAFNQLQSIVYIKVNQQATIELQTLTFKHLHELSLNWHLSKRTGAVIKSMDRGTQAVNNLVTYLFLNLVPAIAQCIAVVILFFTQFQNYSLACLIFGGILLYCLLTVYITLWRRKVRQNANTADNDYHFKATESIVNFETVKFFTAEEYELKGYRDSVIDYQIFNSEFTFALNLLNILQQILLQGTMLGAMLISGMAVINNEMTIGEWIAVQSWVNNLFSPLSFLGGIYAGIIRSLVDVKNLSELLSEQPDIVDAANAIPLVKPRAYQSASVPITSDAVVPGCSGRS
jgi:ABC-type multidrug transport system fused ATPase/permease subunit